MEPIFEYFEIIVNRLQNPLPKEEYGEKHHIYPKSCGGWNHKSNLVRLTRDEHKRCHELLPEIFKDLGEREYHKMLYAWHCINAVDGTSEEDNPEYMEQHRALCRKRGKKLGESNRGKPAWNSGKTGVYSEDTLKRISQSLKGHVPGNKGKKMTPEQCAKISAAKKGKPAWNKGKTGLQHQSEDARRKQAEQISGRKWFNDGSKSYLLKPDDPKIAELHLLLGRK